MSETPTPETRRELEAAIAARHELGDELEPHVLDSFLAQIEQRIDARVDKQLAHKRIRDRGRKEGSFVLALVSLGCGIPITAIALSNGGIAALIVVWAAIVLVNVAYDRR
jgi:Flp pilus assembly protein TadB